MKARRAAVERMSLVHGGKCDSCGVVGYTSVRRALRVLCLKGGAGKHEGPQARR